MANAIMDFVLMGLLVAALWFGVRLDKKLKALRGAHEGFAKAVADLDQAAIRAHHSLKELRADGDESQELLHGRIVAARDLLMKLETQAGRADKAQADMEKHLAAFAALQGRAEQTARRLEAMPQQTVSAAPLRGPAPAEPIRIRPQPRLEDEPDYNPAWSVPPKTPNVARGASQEDKPKARAPFDRDLIRFSDEPKAQPRRSLLPPEMPDEDDGERLDKVQMSELVVANLNEMIRSLTLPTRQPMSVEDDLFGEDSPRKR
jgi:hypothetical protein